MTYEGGRTELDDTAYNRWLENQHRRVQGYPELPILPKIICTEYCQFFKDCERANTLAIPGTECTTFEDGTTAYSINRRALE